MGEASCGWDTCRQAIQNKGPRPDSRVYSQANQNKGPRPEFPQLQTHYPKLGAMPIFSASADTPCKAKGQDFLAASAGSEVSQILLQQLGHVRKLVYHWYLEPDKSPQGQPALNHLWPLNQALIRSNESKMFHLFFWEMDSQGSHSLWRWVLTPISLKLNLGEQNRQNIQNSPASIPH